MSGLRVVFQSHVLSPKLMDDLLSLNFCSAIFAATSCLSHGWMNGAGALLRWKWLGEEAMAGNKLRVGAGLVFGMGAGAAGGVQEVMGL